MKEAIVDSESRVRSMSLIHQKLYRGEDLAVVEMKSYLDTLANNLVDTYTDITSEVDVNLQMDTIELDSKYAIPLGLIANELITNALKHAFNEESKGLITIQLGSRDNEIVLTISDSGQNSLQNQGSSELGGFGSSLVQMLTEQLRGELSQTTSEGFTTEIRFPYLEHVA